MGSPSITSRQVQAQLCLLLQWWQQQICSSHASSVLQIRCRGRGQAPDPAAANEFCWALVDFGLYLKEADLKRWVVVHCTHGYNRTGRWFCHVSQELGRGQATVAMLCTASVPASLSSSRGPGADVPPMQPAGTACPYSLPALAWEAVPPPRLAWGQSGSQG